MIEKIQRLGVIITNKNAIRKDAKAKHEHEISNREEVERSQLKDLEKLQALKDRNMAILRESKKKKKETKELEKEKSKVENELVGLRVENGILVKEITTLKIDIENKATYIKQLKKSKGPSDDNNDSEEEETVADLEEVETVTVVMNKDSQKPKCLACDKTFANTNDLENHIQAKHEQKVCTLCDKSFATTKELDNHTKLKHDQKTCTFCDKTFNTEHQLKGHYNHCIEYGNTVVKCNNCQNTFTRFGIKRHGEMCTGKQNKVYSCSVCGKTAGSFNDVKKHQAEIHAEVTHISKEVCKHWRKGHCTKGNMCLYSHVGYQQKSSSNTTTTTSTSNWTPACHHGEGCSWLAKGNCRYFHKGVGVQKPAPQGAQSSQRPSKTVGNPKAPQNKICHFDGRCSNPVCRFKHSSDEGFRSQRGQNRPQMRVLTNGQFRQ